MNDAPAKRQLEVIKWLHENRTATRAHIYLVSDGL